MSSAMSANDKVAVGLVQMNCEPGNKAANLERAEHLLAELAGRVRIACLPEMLEVGYDLGGLGAAFFELAGLRIGIAICFEHAFPQIFTTLARRGAALVVNPSAVPVGFGYLQDLRTRARAQDNQIFVAAVNHVGKEGTVTYCGRSQVADPRGELVA